MKAIVCRAPYELALEDRPIPARADTEVLVRIRRVGICGTDYHIYEGLHPFLEYPRVIGHELSATVVEAPPRSRFRPGDDVVVDPYVTCGICHACQAGKPNCCMRIAVLGVHRDGGMCEWLSLPERNLIAAEGLSLDAAAAVEFLAIGAHAVRRAGDLSGRNALVIGAGPIGIGTALFARIAGAEVSLMDRDADRLALARAATGLHQTIIADIESDAVLLEISAGNGFDAVFDATGNSESMQASFGHVAHGGVCVFVGVLRADITFADAEFHKREMSLIASRNATRMDFEHVMKALRAGSVQSDALVTHRASLGRVREDLPRWAGEKGGLIKALVEID